MHPEGGYVPSQGVPIARNGNQPKIRQRVDKDLQILDRAIISEDGASWKSRKTVPSIEAVLNDGNLEVISDINYGLGINSYIQGTYLRDQWLLVSLRR